MWPRHDRERSYEGDGVSIGEEIGRPRSLKAKRGVLGIIDGGGRNSLTRILLLPASAMLRCEREGDATGISMS